MADDFHGFIGDVMLDLLHRKRKISSFIGHTTDAGVMI